MSNDERLWWSILLYAQEVADANIDAGSSEVLFQYEAVANRARITLRDKFGVNLDDYSDKAKEQATLMAAEEEAKDQEQKKRIEEGLKAVERAEKLLGIK